MIAADDQIYLRPTAFVDAPYGFDGQCARLAGGLIHFTAIEIIARQKNKARHASELVSLDQWPARLAHFSARQQEEAQKQFAALTSMRAPQNFGAQSLRFDAPVIMGILNATPDSFSDGGRYENVSAAISAAHEMIAQGAAIIDIGGESTRPGAETVWEEDEIVRIAPVFEGLAGASAILSVDTRKAAVMQAALVRGAHIINDVAALGYDERAPIVARDSKAAVVLMHAQGTPQTMQHHPHYDDAALDVFDWLAARRDWAQAQGIELSRIWLDPGIGFGKGVRHNLEIINHLALYHALGCPLLFGASRKRLIGALADEAPTDQRLGGSLALLGTALSQGVQIVRVHDVMESVQMLKIWRGLRDAALLPPVF